MRAVSNFFVKAVLSLCALAIFAPSQRAFAVAVVATAAPTSTPSPEPVTTPEPLEPVVTIAPTEPIPPTGEVINHRREYCDYYLDELANFQSQIDGLMAQMDKIGATMNSLMKMAKIPALRAWALKQLKKQLKEYQRLAKQIADYRDAKANLYRLLREDCVSALS